MKSNYLTKKYYLHFAELGDYECLEYWFNTKAGAEKRLKVLESEYEEYFGFIAEMKVCRRKEGNKPPKEDLANPKGGG